MERYGVYGAQSAVPANAFGPPGYPHFANLAPSAGPSYHGPSYPQFWVGSALPNPDEVRTIFVSGFPPDLRERELTNTVRFLPGFEACQLDRRPDGGSINGFVMFTSAALAAAARTALSGLRFDEQSTLRAEVARKNMLRKRQHAAAPAADYGDAAKRQRAAPGAQPPFAPPPALAPAPSGAFAPASTVKDNPPCNTLFVGNISEGASEEELRGLFSLQPGFRQMKLSRSGHAVCFVEFQDVPSAAAAHQALSGAVLPSSTERGGLRVQYSKSSFNSRKTGAEEGGGGAGPSPAGGRAGRRAR